MDKSQMIRALECLDAKLDRPTRLVLGGGGALILAHGLPLVTHDLDAVPLDMELSELDRLIKQVSVELQIPGDWMNPYFSTFTHTLPADYKDRLAVAFQGQNLKVLALGKDEMLIMKCFAHRLKDVGHAKALIKKGARVKFVESHIEKLLEKRIPLAQEALDFLDELVDES
ncbi:MAG: hypothetical protein H6626_03585 [Pseudobdellovibrionaceae bacterium]|nr:MAG: hypothetical protein H6626_03585 [Pseudobdellovibrionaceae bacterium]